MGRDERPFEQRLKAKIIEDDTGCWIWQGARKGPGYGHVRFQQRDVYTHRASYLAFKGPIPEGQYVLHTCDVRLCCNPDHLFLGTQAENMKDKAVKGRYSTVKRSATHCVRGHERTADNLYKGAQKRCRLCVQERNEKSL